MESERDNFFLLPRINICIKLDIMIEWILYLHYIHIFGLFKSSIKHKSLCFKIIDNWNGLKYLKDFQMKFYFLAKYILNSNETDNYNNI